MTAEIKTGEKMIVFMINGKEYAISVSQVKSIEKWQKPTRSRVWNLISAVLSICAE